MIYTNKYDLYDKIAARTTQKPTDRVNREKNDSEVFPFHCMAIHYFGARFVPVMLHTADGERDTHERSTINSRLLNEEIAQTV